MNGKYGIRYNSGRYTYHHIDVYEKAHGKIPDGYEVHHINGKERDNRIENLVAIPHDEHRIIHSIIRAYGYDISTMTMCDFVSLQTAIESYRKLKEMMQKEWFEFHRKEIAEYHKRYAKEHREKLNEDRRKRRAKARANYKSQGAEGIF